VILDKVRVDVGFPVKDLDEVVKVTDLVLRAVFPEQLGGDDLVVNHGLIHGVDVGCFLWLEGAETSRCVQDARRHVPTRAWIEAVGLGVAGDFVVTLGEVDEALADLVFGGAGLETKKGVGVVRSVVVDLRWEVVGFRFAELPTLAAYSSL